MRCWALPVVVLLLGGPALGEEAAPAAPTGPRSHFTLSFAGGALVPRGPMQDSAQAGLDVDSRIGWNAANGLGVVMTLEYAPLRRGTEESPIDSHMFVATAAPRFTIGHDIFRLWIAAGGGILVERQSIGAKIDVDTVPTLAGSGGLEFHFFDNGGVQLAGGYTRGLSERLVYDFFSLNAGLVFTI